MNSGRETREPSLLSLHGRIDNAVLEEAVAVQRGDYPGWRIAREAASTAELMRPSRLHPLVTVGRIIAALTLLIPGTGSFSGKANVQGRIFVLDTPTGREETVAFEYLGEANGFPLWSRA